MSELKICRICLRTETKVYKYDQYQLKYYYEEVMGLKVDDKDGLPQYFCYECATMLHKFHKFKEKCYIGQKTLKEISWRGPITYATIYKIDRSSKNLQSPIGIMKVTNLNKTYTAKDSMEPTDTQIKNENQRIDEIEIIEYDFICEDDYCETLNDHPDLNKEMDISNENILEKLDCEEKKVKENPPKSCSPTTVFVNDKKEVITLQSEEIQGKRKSRDSDNEGDGNMFQRPTKRKSYLDANHWKKLTLTEEDALKEFRAKAEDKKYLNAAYKCLHCFKGFSKKEMLNRHTQLKHSESLGTYECRFCRMRFKWDCYLRKHMRQHFTKYECLRCHLVFSVENTAIIHEDYHRGVIKKCIHCDEEFRHSSTYYTHLRTHRSEHVCTLCGASFVSDAGLHQHKKVKHIPDQIDSPDDDDEVTTYCERCDIRFETRKAFEEHLFHSAMHTEGVEDEICDELTIPRKVLGKKEQAKITQELRKGGSNTDTFSQSNVKRRRKTKRNHRKPTTCHQCGKHFETQAACMKHHLKEHPKTSFFPTNQRYICEICGSSLAPGSIAVHQNMHTREKIHTCDACGKQFHSSVGLKRHMVTHTGEKPFACTLCDKRFTQSNSRKLHYRTFHLKQPYPKRNRRKNKNDTQNTVEMDDSGSEEESDSLPEPEMDSVPEPEAEIELEPNLMPEPHLPEENIHYLTLN